MLSAYTNLPSLRKPGDKLTHHSKQAGGRSSSGGGSAVRSESTLCWGVPSDGDPDTHVYKLFIQPRLKITPSQTYTNSQKTNSANVRTSGTSTLTTDGPSVTSATTGGPPLVSEHVLIRRCSLFPSSLRNSRWRCCSR